MGHSNVWNSHPKTYGPGSRAWSVSIFLFFLSSVQSSYGVNYLIEIYFIFFPELSVVIASLIAVFDV